MPIPLTIIILTAIVFIAIDAMWRSFCDSDTASKIPAVATGVATALAVMAVSSAGIWNVFGFLVPVVAMIWLMFEYKENRGESRTEIISAILSGGVFSCIATKGAVLIAGEHSFLSRIPIALLVVLIGIVIYSYLDVEREVAEIENSGRSEDARRRISRLLYNSRIRRTAVITTAIVAIVLTLGVSWVHQKPAKVEQPVAEAEAAPVVLETNDDPFAQIIIGHNGHNIDDEYLTKLDSWVNGGDEGEIEKDLILYLCRHSASLLAVHATSCGIWHDANDWSSLLSEDGTTLSELGRNLYYKLEGCFALIVASREQIPSDWVNSGFSDEGGFVVSQSPGISGNLDGLVLRDQRGNVIYGVLHRCGNPAYPPNKVPKVPTGPTDNPDPPNPPNNNPSTPTTEYKKDKSKGTQGNLVAQNDNLGPGSSTNNGIGAQESTLDREDNSSSLESYFEYQEVVEELEEINQDQRIGGEDDNEPSTPPPDNDTEVDNNGDNGTGYGGADDYTRQRPRQERQQTGNPITDEPSGSLARPND